MRKKRIKIILTVKESCDISKTTNCAYGRRQTMVKHIILWTLKETDAEKKAKILADMKEHLEGLVGKVPGLLEVQVRIHPLASSNAEVMLDTTLENEEMLKGYQKHPAHVEVANTYVRPYTDVRMCMDYEV